MVWSKLGAWIGVIFAMFAVSGAPAQTPDTTQRAVAWLQTQWTRVQEEGRPVAEKIVRQFPGRFRSVRAQVARLSQLATQVANPTRLNEKKDLMLELWRVRGSLNLLALCSPDVIHQVTGLDQKTLESLQNQVAAIRANLSSGS